VPLAYLSFTASALVDGRFDPAILEDIEERQDEIGRFTGIFESMARYVSERTRKLEATVEERTRHLNQEIARRQELEDELRALASVDGLTGINNRRHFLELGGKEFSRAQRYGNALSVMMMDVDHFKNINDTYGHAAGDEVLKKLATTFAANLRGPDILGRLGGEEFAVVLPECGIEAAEQAAERLRQILAKVEVPSEQGDITFTIAIGVVGRNRRRGPHRGARPRRQGHVRRQTRRPQSGGQGLESYPAQHDNLETSMSKVCAASFRPSTVVR
jgi:diguanylate cyclase (GGDEF)-like protein